jgi:hypothetical protein
VGSDVENDGRLASQHCEKERIGLVALEAAPIDLAWLEIVTPTFKADPALAGNIDLDEPAGPVQVIDSPISRRPSPVEPPRDGWNCPTE